MKTPELIDSTELDASIEALDAIKPAPDFLAGLGLERNIATGVYWYNAICGDAISNEGQVMRVQSLNEAAFKIGMAVIVAAKTAGVIGK